VDTYLPEAFGRTHPRFGSPYVAVTAQAVIATAFIVMSFVGSTVEQAYLILLDTTLLVYFIPYLYMFAAYVVLRRRSGGGVFAGDSIDTRNPAATRKAPVRRIPASTPLAMIFGACGFLTTLFAMGMSIVPPAGDGAALYLLKVLGGAGAFVATGAVIYARSR